VQLAHPLAGCFFAEGFVLFFSLILRLTCPVQLVMVGVIASTKKQVAKADFIVDPGKIPSFLLEN